MSLKGVEPSEEHRNTPFRCAADKGLREPSKDPPERQRKKDPATSYSKPTLGSVFVCLGGLLQDRNRYNEPLSKGERKRRASIQTDAGGTIDVIKVETRYEASSRCAQSLQFNLIPVLLNFPNCCFSFTDLLARW